MVLLGVVSMVVYAIDQTVLDKLIYTSPDVRDYELWRLFTWPIVNPPREIWVVVTLAFFWFVGHFVEDRVGRKRFTVLIVAATVLPALIVTIFDFTAKTGFAYGLHIVGSALLVVLALDQPNMPFFFNIPAWVIALIFIGIDVLGMLGDRYYGQLVMLLGAIAIACLMARQFGMLNDVNVLPKFDLTRRQGRKRVKRPAVVAGPWAGSGSTADQSELDDLLDKISATGMDSLTRAEKQRLNELSKRLRGG
jgi:membrane associated rhomboid family serine protease